MLELFKRYYLQTYTWNICKSNLGIWSKGLDLNVDLPNFRLDLDRSKPRNTLVHQIQFFFTFNYFYKKFEMYKTACFSAVFCKHAQKKRHFLANRII